jgi:hypothetical protein
MFNNSGLVVWEFTSSAKKAEKKAAEAKAQKEKEAQDLQDRLEAIHARLDAIENKVYGSKGIWGMGLGIFGGSKPPQVIPKSISSSSSSSGTDKLAITNTAVAPTGTTSASAIAQHVDGNSRNSGTATDSSSDGNLKAPETVNSTFSSILTLLRGTDTSQHQQHQEHAQEQIDETVVVGNGAQKQQKQVKASQ